MQSFTSEPKDLFQKASLRMRFFTEREAWSYFRATAFGEAVGWTLLISGIAFKHFITPKNNSPVVVVGQIHGTIFFVYFVSVFILFASLRWSARRTVIAALASIPPYGTLIFEKWIAHKRNVERSTSERQIVVRALILKDHSLLALQPKDSGFWCLPGGVVGKNEPAEVALSRLLLQQTGVSPKSMDLRYVHEYKHRSGDRLELFFKINNFPSYDGAPPKDSVLDSLGFESLTFIDLRSELDIEPSFLKKADTRAHIALKTAQTRFVIS